MTAETLAQELAAIRAGACAACAGTPAVVHGLCSCCEQLRQEIEASPTGTITFRRSLEICAEHGRLTESQREEWLVSESETAG